MSMNALIIMFTPTDVVEDNWVLQVVNSEEFIIDDVASLPSMCLSTTNSSSQISSQWLLDH